MEIMIGHQHQERLSCVNTFTTIMLEQNSPRQGEMKGPHPKQVKAHPVSEAPAAGSSQIQHPFR